MELPRISPSNVVCLDCAYRFKTLYIDRKWPPRQPPLLAAEFGTAFHEVMKHVYDPRQRPLPNLEPLDTRIRAAFFARRYPDAGYRAVEMARCQRMVEGYVAQDADALATVDVERQGAFLIAWRGSPLFMLSAKFDRVIVRPDEPARLVVRDYKTTIRRVQMEEAFVTLWAAKLLYPGYARYALELEWVDGADGSAERDTVEGAQLKGMHKIILDKAVRVLTASAWPPQPGDICTFCPLKRDCQPPGAAYDGERDVFGEDA